MLDPQKTSNDKPRQHMKKQRHHFANKSPYSQNYGFSTSRVRRWELDNKEAECQRTDAFELWCWKRFLRVPWTARRSNQSLKCSLEELTLKLQYFGHLMWRTDSLEKTLMLGKIEGRRTWGRQRMRGLDGITNPMDMSLNKLQEMVKGREVYFDCQSTWKNIFKSQYNEGLSLWKVIFP